MRSFWKDFGLAVLMGFVLPGLLLTFAAEVLKQEEPALAVQTPAQTTQQQEQECVWMLLRQADGSVERMELEEYLVGVVLAEMPAEFETEALKAQAVVARTYTYRAYITGGKHGDGSVCADCGCCQAYLSETDYLIRGGNGENVDKIRMAVADTQGLVLTYQGELIEATYFSCSGGCTEDAAAVWGTEVPYLRATLSPGEELAAYDTDTVSFSADQFQNALGVALSGAPESWFGAVTHTAGGGVDTMVIGGSVWKGTYLRQLLELRSTAFTVMVHGDTITITTRGYGHRVGMSQYGADAMAVNGSGYQEILAYYYHGTQLEKIPGSFETG